MIALPMWQKPYPRLISCEIGLIAGSLDLLCEKAAYLLIGPIRGRSKGASSRRSWHTAGG
jgi:hypothetical protein